MILPSSSQNTWDLHTVPLFQIILPATSISNSLTVLQSTRANFLVWYFLLCTLFLQYCGV